jgi:hypothetical protein
VYIKLSTDDSGDLFRRLKPAATDFNVFVVKLFLILHSSLYIQDLCEVIDDEKKIIGSFTGFGLYAWICEWLLVKASPG